MFLLVFASSAFVPVRTMPGWLQAFADVRPASATVNAVRALAEGGPTFHWFWPSLAAPGVDAVVTDRPARAIFLRGQQLSPCPAL